jgi:hypothetical protein
VLFGLYRRFVAPHPRGLLGSKVVPLVPSVLAVVVPPSCRPTMMKVVVLSLGLGLRVFNLVVCSV